MASVNATMKRKKERFLRRLLPAKPAHPSAGHTCCSRLGIIIIKIKYLVIQAGPDNVGIGSPGGELQ